MARLFVFLRIYAGKRLVIINCIHGGVNWRFILYIRVASLTLYITDNLTHCTSWHTCTLVEGVSFGKL